ncbi:MAG TPA: type III pantothenate kinase [Ignavibacteria bacterium]|nr:type III pantothenate kinase [Ignavibacteria bacterium]HRJ99101.1 type III pantothenate kinase [Ignavibacteria bacterium]
MENRKRLLIDIGNTAVKAASGSLKGNKISFLAGVSYDKDLFEKQFSSFIKKLFRDYQKNNFLLTGISSLSTKRNSFIKKTIRTHSDIKPVFINIKMKLPIKIDYAHTIGNDRICSAVAANDIFPGKNILVIDFGTASTYTFVSNGILKGGIISPGILTAINSLSEKASLIKTKPVFPESLINKTTEKNINAGVLYQTLYFCERVIRETSNKLSNLKVIATGGFSGLISGRTKLIDLTDRDLVFKGINLILQLNENNHK